MEEGPSRNHGAFTREASLLNKKKLYLRAIRVHWEYFCCRTINLDHQYINRFSKGL